MNFDAYNGNTLQSLNALLSQAEDEGITEVTELQNQLRNSLAVRHKPSPVRKRPIPPKQYGICGSCGNSMKPPKLVDDMLLQGCRKCGFSRRLR